MIAKFKLFLSISSSALAFSALSLIVILDAQAAAPNSVCSDLFLEELPPMPVGKVNIQQLLQARIEFGISRHLIAHFVYRPVDSMTNPRNPGSLVRSPINTEEILTQVIKKAHLDSIGGTTISEWTRQTKYFEIYHQGNLHKIASAYYLSEVEAEQVLQTLATMAAYPDVSDSAIQAIRNHSMGKIAAHNQALRIFRRDHFFSGGSKAAYADIAQLEHDIRTEMELTPVPSFDVIDTLESLLPQLEAILSRAKVQSRYYDTRIRLLETPAQTLLRAVSMVSLSQTPWGDPFIHFFATGGELSPSEAEYAKKILQTRISQFESLSKQLQATKDVPAHEQPLVTQTLTVLDTDIQLMKTYSAAIDQGPDQLNQALQLQMQWALRLGAVHADLMSFFHF